jgi:hypothetical protein
MLSRPFAVRPTKSACGIDDNTVPQIQIVLVLVADRKNRAREIRGQANLPRQQAPSGLPSKGRLFGLVAAEFLEPCIQFGFASSQPGQLCGDFHQAGFNRS